MKDVQSRREDQKTRKNGSQKRKRTNRNKFTSDGDGTTFDKTTVVKSRTNDWRWYAANEQILKDVASFPYGWPLGNPINYGPSGLDANNWALPGVCAIEVAPTPGYADDINDPVNIAARNAYSYIRHANSGSANYDSPDLMLYFLAMDNLYMMLSYMKRIYGIAMTTSPVNRYFPKAVVQAMGVDYDDIRRNLNDFRAMLNMAIVKAGSLCVPATMSYMLKHMWMFEGVYKDVDINKAQMYMFVPHGYFKFGLDNSSAGQLVWTPIYNHYNLTNLLTYSDLVTILDDIMDPILSGAGAQDFNIMSGDILKAYGAENVLHLATIPADYAVLPEYREEVLDQIQNLSLMGRLIADSNQNIHQDTTKTYLKYTPKFLNSVPFTGDPARPNTVTVVAGDNTFTSKKVISFDREVVEPAHTMEATRMTNIASKIELVPGKYWHSITCDTLASEVACRASIYRYSIDSNGELSLELKRTFNQSWTFLNIVANTSTATVASQAANFQTMYDNMNELMAQLTYFHRHPYVAVTAGIVDEATGTWNFDSFNGYFGDINYYTIIDHDDLKQLAQAALISEFAVTQYGRANEKIK